MNTFSNFSSLNGWQLPGSGTWVTRDIGDFYVDENGDLWVPCFCGEGAAGITGTGATGATGSTGATGGIAAPTGAEAEDTMPTGANEEAMLPQEMALIRRMDEMLDIVRRLECLHAKELESL